MSAMKTKKRLLWGLAGLVGAAALAAGLLWGYEGARTARAEAVNAVRGRLEDEIALEGEVYFAGSEPHYIRGAASMNLYVERVAVQPGSYVKAGDVIYEASLPSYEAELEKVYQLYRAEVSKYAEKSAAGLHFGQSSPHNDYYNAMMAATEEYWDKLYLARAAALAAGQELPDDASAWLSAAAGEAELAGAVREAAAAKQRMDEATATLKSIYDKGVPVPRLGDAYFNYIRELDTLKEGVYRQLAALMDFEHRVQGLKTGRAERDGWIAELNLKEGELYDGGKPAWRLSAEGEQPLLRCEIGGLEREIAPGTRARLAGGEEAFTVTGTEEKEDGRKYLLLAPDGALVTQEGKLAALMEEKQDLLLDYRSERETALLPAAALRLDSQGNYFVWTADRQGSLIPGLSPLRVRRQAVTVLDTSGDTVAVEEDLKDIELLLREDRALREGMRVLIR